ncbi:MarR family winged helix-turn-helix transcriptional regulator [Streptomyces sp. NPDC054949]
MTDTTRDPADAVELGVEYLLGNELSSRWDSDQKRAWAGVMEISRLLPAKHDREMIAEHGLSLTLLRLLGGLNERDQPQARDLAADLDMSTGRVSRHLATLEAAGLLRRTHNAEDKRSLDVELTDAGRARLAAARQTALEIVERDFLAHLTPDEMATLARITTRVLRANASTDNAR